MALTPLLLSYKRWMQTALLVASLLATIGACKKEPSSSSPPAGASPGAPASTTEIDALWALAPEGATQGGVISPRAVAGIEGAWLAIDKFIRDAPELAMVKTMLEARLQQTLGTSTLRLDQLGLSPAKGIAIFADDDAPLAIILPVIDRAKFRAATKGKQDGDTDLIARMVCREVKAVYACGESSAHLDKIGKGDLSKQRARLPARGDIELAIKAGANVSTAGVGQIDRGAITFRVAMHGAPPTVTSKLTNTKPRVDDGKTAGFAVANLIPFLVDLPPMELAPGVRVDELGRSIAGPLTLTTTGSSIPSFDVRIPLGDPGPAKKLIEGCASLPQLAMLGATFENGECSVPVPQLGIAIQLRVEGTELRASQKGAASAPAVTLSPLGKELAKGTWAFAVYGRGSLLAGAPMQSFKGAADMLPPEALIGIRAMVMLSELGVGVRVEQGVVHAVLGIRTAWANPDDVIAKIVAITPTDVIAGKAEATAKAIATAAPSSPFAADHAAGWGGLMLQSAGIGMLAAIAIPAFMDYMKKSKKTEAALLLNKLAKNLKVYHAVNGSFPKGSVGHSPVRPCCEGPGHKCFDQAAWKDPVWQELDFVIEDPHLFQYTYDSDGGTVHAQAIGDLDCDGNVITYALHGTADHAGKVSTTITEPAPNTD